MSQRPGGSTARRDYRPLVNNVLEQYVTTHPWSPRAVSPQQISRKPNKYPCMLALFLLWLALPPYRRHFKLGGHGLVNEFPLVFPNIVTRHSVSLRRRLTRQDDRLSVVCRRFTANVPGEESQSTLLCFTVARVVRGIIGGRGWWWCGGCFATGVVLRSAPPNLAKRCVFLAAHKV